MQIIRDSYGREYGGELLNGRRTLRRLVRMPDGFALMNRDRKRHVIQAARELDKARARRRRRRMKSQHDAAQKRRAGR